MGPEGSQNLIESSLAWADKTVHGPRLFIDTCAPFSSGELGPVPAGLLKMYVEVQEWKDMSEAILEEVRLIAGTNEEHSLAHELGAQPEPEPVSTNPKSS